MDTRAIAQIVVLNKLMNPVCIIAPLGFRKISEFWESGSLRYRKLFCKYQKSRFFAWIFSPEEWKNTGLEIQILFQDLDFYFTVHKSLISLAKGGLKIKKINVLICDHHLQCLWFFKEITLLTSSLNIFWHGHKSKHGRPFLCVTVAEHVNAVLVITSTFPSNADVPGMSWEIHASGLSINKKSSWQLWSFHFVTCF